MTGRGDERVGRPGRAAAGGVSTHGLTRAQLLARLGVAGAALTVPGWLVGCGGEEEPTGGGTGTAGGGGEIEKLTWASTAISAIDYASDFSLQAGVPVAITLETLLIYDENLALEPVLAESWSQPDPLTYVFKVREGVKFWDGTPLTADDVVYSIERHLDPKVASQAGFYFESVKGVKETGPAEVTVSLKTPDPFFSHVQTFTTILPRKFSEEQGKDLATPGRQPTIMGTGPYRVEAFRADELISLVRNEQYWGEKPAVKAIDIRMIPDPQALQLAMRSGEIDGTFQVPVAQIDQWSEMEGVNTLSVPGMGVHYLYFQVDKEPWNDVHVRRAIAHAIDREGLVRTVLRDHGEPATSIVPPVQWGDLRSQEELDELYGGLPAYPFDLEAAKEELAQSAVPDGFSASIEYPNTMAEAGKALQHLAENLKQLNIDLEVKEVTQNAHGEAIEAGRYAFGVTGLVPDYADPADYLHILLGKGSYYNTARYENEEVLDLLREQKTSNDEETRAEATEQVMAIAQEDLPYLGLWWLDAVAATKDTITYEAFSPLWYQQQWIRYIKPAA